MSINPNHDNILLKVSNDGECIAISTYDRAHGRRGRFLVVKSRITEWDGISTTYDMDCGNLLKMQGDNSGDSIRMEFYWISMLQRRHLPRLHAKCVTVPANCSLMCCIAERRFATCASPTIAALLLIRGARCRTLRMVQSDKAAKRALSKAMRDLFHWHGDQVTLFNDGTRDFYFSTEGGWKINGGLILHRDTVRTPRGNFSRCHYSIHT
jgi:hypothetical protein